MAASKDYALLNLQSGPLISRNGSVDWLCVPPLRLVVRSLWNTNDHARWILAPKQPAAVVIDRQSVDSTFILLSLWPTDSGQSLVTDFMSVDAGSSSLVRRVGTQDPARICHSTNLGQPFPR